MKGNELKSRRRALGISQRELGRRANIAQQHLSQMEAGARAIGPRTRWRLEYALAALELDQAARRARIRACVDRVMARPDMVALREHWAQLEAEF